MKPSKDLYTTTEVKEVREKLLKEQKSLDALTGLPIPTGQAVLDHCHKTQYVRGVLHRQSNATLGKVENLYIRYLSWWYEGTLSDFLRATAEYLSKEHPTEYTHPAWLKRVQTDFNKLTAKQKDTILETIAGVTEGNDTQRKKLFKETLLTRLYDFVTIKSLLQEVKDLHET